VRRRRGDAAKTFEAALECIAQRVGDVMARSRWYLTKAMVLEGAAAQPDYLNGAVLVESAHDPALVLRKLLAIERELGRDRAREREKWSPRALDLDLILADDKVLQTAQLALPHPEMHRRDFVLAPLLEVWPDWRHPLLGKSAVELLREIETRSIKEVRSPCSAPS
jgi:2-amino-4-hydroxy-6-hydroxymethyldihydropteridine diphosphokinase